MECAAAAKKARRPTISRNVLLIARALEEEVKRQQAEIEERIRGNFTLQSKINDSEFERANLEAKLLQQDGKVQELSG